MAAEGAVGLGVETGRHAARGLGYEDAAVGLDETDLHHRRAVHLAGVGHDLIEEVIGVGTGLEGEEDLLDEARGPAERGDGVGAERPLSAFFAPVEAGVDDDVRAVHEQGQLAVLELRGRIIGVGEHHDRDGDRAGGDGEERPGAVVLLGDLLLEAADDSADADGVPLLLVEVDAIRGDDHRGDGFVEAVVVGEGVAAEVEAEQRLLAIEHLELGHLLRLAEDEVSRAGGAGVLGSEEVEEGALAAGAFLALAGEVAADGFDGVDEVTAVFAGEIEGARAHETVEGAGIEVELTHAAHEVAEVLEGPVLLALPHINNCLSYRWFSNICRRILRSQSLHSRR